VTAHRDHESHDEATKIAVKAMGRRRDERE